MIFCIGDEHEVLCMRLCVKVGVFCLVDFCFVLRDFLLNYIGDCVAVQRLGPPPPENLRESPLSETSPGRWVFTSCCLLTYSYLVIYIHCSSIWTKWEMFLHGKFRSLSLRKASCNRVALPRGIDVLCWWNLCRILLLLFTAIGPYLLISHKGLDTHITTLRLRACSHKLNIAG